MNEGSETRRGIANSVVYHRDHGPDASVDGAGTRTVDQPGERYRSPILAEAEPFSYCDLPHGVALPAMLRLREPELQANYTEYRADLLDVVATDVQSKAKQAAAELTLHTKR